MLRKQFLRTLENQKFAALNVNLNQVGNSSRIENIAIQGNGASRAECLFEGREVGRVESSDS
jgi:hypothetical protein